MVLHPSAASDNKAIDTATLLDRLSDDPELAKLFSDFRRQAFAILDRNVTELVSKFGEETRANAKAKLLSSATTHRLTTASRQSARTVQSRRKFARDILVAGMYNQHNPEWDMTDADTYRTETDDIIVLLMQRPDPLHQQTVKRNTETISRT